MSSGEHEPKLFSAEEAKLPKSYWKNPDGEVISVVSHWKEAVIEFRQQREAARVKLQSQTISEEMTEQSPEQEQEKRTPIGLQDWGPRQSMVIHSQSEQIVASDKAPAHGAVIPLQD